MKIRSVWSELPAKMTRIDAAYEFTEEKQGKNLQSSRVWFFVGSEIYIFDGAKLELKLSLRDIGIDTKKYSKIDAIFRWPYNNQTYIFSGEKYWKFDGTKVVSKDYPRKITEVWAEAFEINSAFIKEEKLFFLKGECYLEFNTGCMQLKRMSCNNIGRDFLGCPAKPDKKRKSFDVVTISPEECEEVTRNFEKNPQFVEGSRE